MNSKDRADLIKRISDIEGLTDKERSALLGLLRENKTYGLVWEDKPEDIEERLRDELPILTDVPSLRNSSLSSSFLSDKSAHTEPSSLR